jgi:hypothetical protein
MEVATDNRPASNVPERESDGREVHEIREAVRRATLLSADEILAVVTDELRRTR